MSELAAFHPDWNHLYETAAEQSGLFTTQQAAKAGYSPQLLIHHLHSRRIVRIRHGVYRLVHFPPSETEPLTELWLWSDRTGVFSHQTALSLHRLSDNLPSGFDLTLPMSQKRRRLRVPDGVSLHHRDLAPTERTWFGPVFITSPARTLNDCARANLSPELLQQATRQALERGIVTRAELTEVAVALKPYGGI